jgi:Fic family protein
MQDLIAFSNRDDLPVLVQAAVVHAQFENIHPFVDGNGRIGRALVSVILRRRGVSKMVTIPLAAALGANREQYFESLSQWRLGNAQPIIELFVTGIAAASLEAATTADVIETLPKLWQERLGRASTANLASKALAFLSNQPIFNANDLAETLGVPLTSAYPAISKLEAADIIRPLTDRTRNQIWGAHEILEELEHLELRIGARTSQTNRPSELP